jgi:hypothetical protein
MGRKEKEEKEKREFMRSLGDWLIEDTKSICMEFSEEIKIKAQLHGKKIDEVLVPIERGGGKKQS